MKKIILINFTLIISFFLIFEIFLRVFNLSSLRGMSEHYFFNNKKDVWSNLAASAPETDPSEDLRVCGPKIIQNYALAVTLWGNFGCVISPGCVPFPFFGHVPAAKGKTLYPSQN